MQLSSQNHSDHIEPLSLNDLLGTLRRHSVLIGLAILAFLLLGFIYYKTTPSEYSAKAVVLIENQERNVQIKAVLTSADDDFTMIPSEIQVLTSRDLVGKVVDRLGLVQNPTLLSAEPKTEIAKPETEPSKENLGRMRDNMIDRMLGALKVKQVEKSRAIEVAFQAKNPKIAADVVNTLTNLYIEQQLSSNFDAIRMTNEWLSARVVETQKKVMEADTKVAKYREAAGIVDSRGIDLIEQNIAELSNKLTAANADVAATQAQMGSVSDPNKLESAPQILSSPLIQGLRQKEADSRNELASLQNQLGASHPKVLTARAEVNEISSKIRQETTRIAEGLRRENQTANDNVANIEKQLDKLKEEYNKYKSNNIELAALESEAATNHAFLETLSLRLKETQSQEDNKFQTPYARIISSAPIPGYPSSPNGKLIMLVSLIVGIGIGCGAALAIDILHNGIYNGKQAQHITGKTNIASVPKAKLNPEKGLITYADFAIHAASSAYMQGIRAISMFLRMELNKHPEAKVFNFTSAAVGEGKSAIAVSVARQLALEGIKVLAIDLDVTQPSLTNTFGLMQKPGLNDLLSGSAALSNILYKDKQTGATLMGVGRLDNINIMSQNFGQWKSLIESLMTQFDIILLDSPPVMSSPETRFLAKLSRNILCVRWKKTPVKSLCFAIDTLERLECAVAGTVITMSQDKRKSVRYSYRS